MFTQIRVCPLPGQQPAEGIFAIVANDTGSDLLLLHPTDIVALGVDNDYAFWGPNEDVVTANGVVCRRTLKLQVRIFSCSGDQRTSDWFDEWAAIGRPHDHFLRLSGAQVRNHFLFATSRGNGALAIGSDLFALGLEIGSNRLLFS